MNDLLFYIFDYAVVIPAAIMCMLPVLKYSRLKVSVLIPSVIGAAAVASVIMGILEQLFGVDPNIPLFIFLIPALILYLTAFDIHKLKLFFIFISTMAVFSFGGLATHIVHSYASPDNTLYLELTAKWVISLAFLAVELLFIRQLGWLFDNDNINSVWKFIWTIPTIVTAANIFMIPQNHLTVRVGRIFQLYVMVEIILIVFYFTILVMLYHIARAVTEKAESEQGARLLELQAAQYNNLKKYLDNTARMRHDFIYMAKTAQALAANNDTEQLRKLLEEYGAGIDANSAPPIFCEHIALNAITAYYAAEAREKKIGFNAKLNVSEKIVISDYELCSVVGNILDNALSAAQNVRDSTPEILFVADTKPNGDLYIAVSNSFDGTIIEKGGKYISTKATGHGIGLESVRAIVQKNKGYCKFRYDDKSFYSEIILRQV